MENYPIYMEKIRRGDYVKLINPGQFDDKYPFMVVDVVINHKGSWVVTYIPGHVGDESAAWYPLTDVILVHKVRHDPPLYPEDPINV